MTSLLIADDHPLFRAALRQAAGESVAGCTVREAADLAGVLAALAADPDTDLVLLDLHMPGSPGLSGLAALRGQHPGVAVLVVSAHDDPRTVRRVLDHGAAGFIPKSASPAESAKPSAASSTAAPGSRPTSPTPSPPCPRTSPTRTSPAASPASPNSNPAS